MPRRARVPLEGLPGRRAQRSSRRCATSDAARRACRGGRAADRRRRRGADRARAPGLVQRRRRPLSSGPSGRLRLPGCRRPDARSGPDERPTPIRVIASAPGRWDDTPWPRPDPPARPERTRVTRTDDALPASQRRPRSPRSRRTCGWSAISRRTPWPRTGAICCSWRPSSHARTRSLADARSRDRSAGSSPSSTRSATRAPRSRAGSAAIHTFYRWARRRRPGRRTTRRCCSAGRRSRTGCPTVLRPSEAAALVEAPAHAGRRRRPDPMRAPSAPARPAILELLYGSGLRVERGRPALTLERRRPRPAAGCSCWARGRRSARCRCPTPRSTRVGDLARGGRPVLRGRPTGGRSS